MKVWERPRARPAAVQTDKGITRRTVAVGAAWAAPVVAVGVAAPAFAASQAVCLTATVTTAVYSGANGRWQFSFNVKNCGTETVKVTGVDVFTTYAAPATNPTNSAVASFALSSANILSGATANVGMGGRDNFDIEPNIFGSDSHSEDYYNAYPSSSGATIDCLEPGVNSGSALYPDSCQHLLNENTYFMVKFQTVSGTIQQAQVQANFTGMVLCSVVAGCDK